MAGKQLNMLSDEEISEILNTVADATAAQIPYILEENQKDLDEMDENDPKYDRLLLTAERIEGIANDMRAVALLPSPLGRTLMSTTRPNGLHIKKVSVPFGVIGIIYEARPNVSLDVFSLCFKSGNACILKGGSDAEHSNQALVGIIQSVLREYGVKPATCTLLPSDRSATVELLQAVGYVDLIIPRGSKGLIDFVRENARVPVIETGAGICHTYFDTYGDLEKGRAIIYNAKTRRVSVCNALDCLVIHYSRLKDLPYLCEPLREKNVVIYADDKSYRELASSYPEYLLRTVEPDSYGTEFLDYKMSIKTVNDIEEAIVHIDQHSSRHSECIISEHQANIDLFEKMIDAACVYSNASTAFSDGAQFGLGAEIGISTQKLHARGPMGLEALTSYKWIIQGDGQTRV